MAFGGGGMSSSVGLGFVMGLTDNVSGTATKIGASIVTLRSRIQSLQTGFLVLGGALTGLGVGLSSVLMKGVKDAAAFEVQMRMLQSITGLTWQETKSLGDEFDRITATLPMSSSELATMAIAAGKLGLASKGGVEALKEVAIQATYMGKALGFSGEQSINMIGRLGTVFGMLDAGSIYRSWDAESRNYYDNAADGAEKTALVQAQLMHNVKGTAAALTQMSFASSQSADFLSDVAIRAGQGAQMMKKTAAETIALAAILADVGVRAEAGGTALGKFFTEFHGNMSGYEQMIKVFGADKLGLGIQELRDLTRDNPAEAVNRVLEAMGQAKYLDPVKFNEMASVLGIKNMRVKQVVQGLADAGATMVTVNADMYSSFKKLSPELSSVAQEAGDGSAQISRLRYMQLLATKASEEASVAAAAYNNVAQTTSLLWSTMVGSITNVSKKLGGMLLPATQMLLQTAVNLMGRLFDLNDTFFKIAATVVGVTSAILILSGAVLLAASAWMMFGGFVMAALLPVTILIEAITAAVAGFVVVMKLMSKEGEGIFDVFARLIDGGFSQFLNFAQGFTEAWDVMSGYFLKPWEEAMDLFRQGVENFKSILPPMKGVEEAFQAIGVVLAMGVGVAIRKVGKYVEWLSVLFTGFALGFHMQVGDRLVAPINSMMKSLKKIGEVFLKVFGRLMPKGMKDLAGDFIKARKAGKSMADDVVGAFKRMAQTLEFVVALLDGEGIMAFKKFGKEGAPLAHKYGQAVSGLSEAYEKLFGQTELLKAFKQLWGDFLGGMKARAIPTLQGVLLLLEGIMDGIGKSGPALEKGMLAIVDIMGSVGKVFLGASILAGKFTGILGAFLGAAISYLLPGVLDLLARVGTVIAGILDPVSNLVQELGKMPLSLEAFGALGEGVGKALSGIGSLFAWLFEQVGNDTANFLTGFVEGFTAFIGPIGEGLNQLAIMTGFVLGMLGDSLTRLTGSSESTGEALRVIGIVVGAVLGTAIQMLLLGLTTVIFALGNMISIWVFFIDLAKAGFAVFANGPRVFMASLGLLKAHLTNMFSTLQVMMVSLAAALAKAIVVALSTIPGIGLLLDVKGANKKIDAMKKQGIAKAQKGRVEKGEMEGLVETFRGATAEARHQATDAVDNLTKSLGSGFNQWLDSGDAILNAQNRTADGQDKIAGVLATGQTNIGEPKPAAIQGPTLPPGFLASMAAPSAQQATPVDTGAIVAAIQSAEVSVDVENTVNFTAQQSFVLNATLRMPGVADMLRTQGQRLTSLERRTVVVGGES